MNATAVIASVAYVGGSLTTFAICNQQLWLAGVLFISTILIDVMLSIWLSGQQPGKT